MAWFIKPSVYIFRCTIGTGKCYVYNEITLFFVRALDIAMKHKTHIDTVLYKRQKYLEVLEKEESNNKFSSLKDQVSIKFTLHLSRNYFNTVSF